MDGIDQGAAASARGPVALTRIAATGVAGLPDLELELGPVTALVGPRGSGKSQLLGAIAWLLAGGTNPASAGRRAQVSGTLRAGDASWRLVGTEAGPVGDDQAPLPRLPGCSLLRARDRLGPMPASGGVVASRVRELAGHRTSDAVAAEALVAAIEDCCEACVSGEMLLIEEPELLLTPQAQRYLYRLLRRFAEGGNQVGYSTRSSAFLDAVHHDEIVRLDLHRGRGSLRRTSMPTLADAALVRLAAEFDHERSEMFFADTVVLVEGQTERLALPFVFQAMGHDPDAAGIAIVEVGGKSNLPLAARLLRELEIPFVVVFDADRGSASLALDAEIRRAAGTAPTIRLEPDFEAVAGIASKTDKVLHAWQRFARTEPASVPAALAEIVRSARARVSDGRPGGGTPGAPATN